MNNMNNINIPPPHLITPPSSPILVRHLITPPPAPNLPPSHLITPPSSPILVRHPPNSPFSPITCFDENPITHYEYVQFELFKFIDGLNKRFTPKKTRGYLTNRTDKPSPQERSHVIDWIIDTHVFFKLEPETLYKTVMLMDTYLANMSEEFEKKNLMMIAACSLMVSTHDVQGRDLLFDEMKNKLDTRYSEDDFCDMIGCMFDNSSSYIHVTSAYEFLVQYMKISYTDKRTAQMACFILDSTLQSDELMQFSHAIIAAASLYLACKVQYEEGFNSHLFNYNRFGDEELNHIAGIIRGRLQDRTVTMEAFERKYGAPLPGNTIGSGWDEVFDRDVFTFETTL